MNQTHAPIALTGIKPTGTPHLGNYLGAILPALELSTTYHALYFIADYHALTTIKESEKLHALTYEIAATWLALGLDPKKTTLYRQSDIPEIFELAWILSCFTGKGLLNRAHAYKAATDKNIADGLDPDFEINAGLYNYPTLMAADILLFGADVVPVGLDQKQHLEIARDIGAAINHTYSKTHPSQTFAPLTLPKPLILDRVQTITGLDGRKMSKSYDNTIPIFAKTDELKKRVMRIVSGSQRVEEPKDPDTCNIFAIYRHFAEPKDIETTRARYLAGGVSYKEMKDAVFTLLETRFAKARDTYTALISDKATLDQILCDGKEKARAIAAPRLTAIRRMIGIGEV